MVDVWICLEYRPVWKAKVLEDNALSAPVRDWLTDALARLEKPGEALEILATESDRLAKAAKVNIAWKAALWPEAAEALSELVGVPPADGQEISAEQADTVVNYGIALALANDLDSLETLG